MSAEFQVEGQNPNALFTLKVHRGEGMALLGMNWRKGTPPPEFVGFAIDYKEPGGDRFFTLKNRLAFLDSAGRVNPDTQPTTLAPIQKFRWVHFPRNADLEGDFVYRVTPVFMNDKDELSVGEFQDASIELRRETYPGQLNVAFTRGFVSSQAFVDRFEEHGDISTLLPEDADDGLTFKPSHPDTEEALAWMGFEARQAVLAVLDEAIADKKAQVRVVAYDLSEADVVARLQQLGSRLRIIIDDDGPHGEPQSGETQSEERLVASAGRDNVRRQHMGKLQHNKTIVVDGPKTQIAVCGSTNYSWRGFFVQANNAMILRGKEAVALFGKAFENYWTNDNDVAAFSSTASAKPTKLDLTDIDVRVGFSPYSPKNAQLAKIADDMRATKSSLLYSLAFISLTKAEAPIRQAIKAVTEDQTKFVYGISDKKFGGIDLQTPGTSNLLPVSPAALAKNAPEPFKSEPAAGGGARMHHKFVVIDFDKPTARVYLGSYNFSDSADNSNGENLLLVRDRRIATSYAVEALRIFDHYHFRIAQKEAKSKRKKLALAKPPRTPGEKPWWDEDFTAPQKIRDRELFA